MKNDLLITTFLVIILVITAAITITSRMWLLEIHRDLQQTEKKQDRLLDQEQALQIELVSRTDLNYTERLAREKLGMRAMRPDQWQVVPK
ncbi:MAG: cell division protein FtsL [Magnetococcales bacterium]|nr:cell division protein FtsL [Magnetococcales bacterium]